jgi:hypothetical protein
VVNPAFYLAYARSLLTRSDAAQGAPRRRGHDE